MLYKIAVLSIFFLFLCFDAEAQRDLRRSPVVKVVEKAGPAIVNISTTRMAAGYSSPSFDEFYRRYPYAYKTQSLGSGILIDKQGFIVTNYHVIRRATKIRVTLHNKKNYYARLLVHDANHDLALLKINDRRELPYIEWGNSSDLMAGETVIALGNPFGLQNTVTTGVVSATDRSIALEGKVAFHDFIQTDAAINPGNSGGALLNIEGRLIGINTAMYSKGQGLGFAIPVKRIRRIIGNLLEYRKSKGFWLGLELEELDRNQQDWLVRVAQIAANSPAAAAKINPGDYIVAINSKPVKCLFDFRKEIYLKKMGDLITLHLSSSKEKENTRKIDISIKALPLHFQYNTLWRRLGIIVLEQNGLLRVKSVRRNSSAHRIGIVPGDIIVSIADYPMSSTAGMIRLIKKIRRGEAVPIVLVRNGRHLGGRIVFD